MFQVLQRSGIREQADGFLRNCSRSFSIVICLAVTISPILGGEKISSLPEGALARFTAPKGEKKLVPVGFTSDGESLILMTDSALLSGNIRTGKTKRILPHQEMNTRKFRLRNAAVSPGGKYLAINGFAIVKSHFEQPFIVFDLASGKKIRSFTHSFFTMYRYLSFSPDGKYLAWWNGRSAILVRKNVNKAEIQTIPANPATRAFAFSSNSKELVQAIGGGGHKDCKLRIWDLNTCRQVAVLSENRYLSSGQISFSPIRNTLAVGGGVISLWDLDSRRIYRRINLSVGTVYWLADATSLMVIASRTTKYSKRQVGIPCLVELVTGDEVCQIHGHSMHVQHVVSDHRATVAASGDGKEVLVWDLQAPPQLKVDIGRKLSAIESNELWRELDNKSAPKAYRAMLQLAQDGKSTSQFLRKKMAPAPKANPEEMRQLLVKLNSESFKERAKSMGRLKQSGRMALRYLEDALKQDPPLEARVRMQKLLDELTATKFLSGELRSYRAVQALLRTNTKDAREFLHELARGGTWSMQTQAALQAVECLRLRERQLQVLK